MIKLRELYYCEICGNVVEVLYAGAPALVCCGEDMQKLEAKTEDEGNEKHVPVVEETDSGIEVRVGDVDHPMLDKHYIQFIEVLTKDKVLRAELNPGDTPQANFSVPYSDVLTVREYCNVHSLWKTE